MVLSADIGPDLVDSGATFGRFRRAVVEFRSASREICPKPGRSLPTLVGLGPQSVEFSPHVVRARAGTAQFVPFLARARPASTKTCPEAVCFGPEAAKLAPRSAKVEQLEPGFGRARPGFCQVWAISSGKSACIPRSCAAIVPERELSHVACVTTRAPLALPWRVDMRAARRISSRRIRRRSWR